MPSDVIPAGPVHFSRLKKMRLSPAHYLDHEEPATPSKGKGSAVHSVMLGGKRVVVYEDGKRDERVEKWRDFKAANDGALILIPSESANVVGMRKSLEAHPVAMRLLDGIRETLIEWEFAGRKCAGTPDVVHLDGLPAMRFGEFSFPGCAGKVGVELKTSKTAAPWSFPWECKRYGYHEQCSWYGQGIESTLAYPAGEVGGYFIVTVENTKPWPVTIFQVEDRDLRAARMQWRSWLDTLLECERSGKFPAYTTGVVSTNIGDDLGLDFTAEDDEAA
jgi:hypothetical protein